MSIVTQVLSLKGPSMWSSPLPCGWSTLDWSFRGQSSGMKTFIRPTTEAYLVGSTFHFEGVWLVSCRLSAWPASVCPSQMLLLRSYPLRVWECCGTAHCRLSSWSSTQLCTSCSMRPWRGGWDEKDARWEQVKKAPRQRIRIKMSEWLYGSLGYVAFHCVGSSNLYWPCKAVFILGFLSQISSAEIFVIGAIAKAIAATSTYPLQTVQTILRVKTNLTHIFSCWQKPLTDNSWCRYECFPWPDQDSIQRWLASGSICLLQVEQKRCLTLCHLSWQIFTSLGRKGDSPVYGLSTVRAVQRWQRRLDGEPLEHFLPAHGQNQVSRFLDFDWQQSTQHWTAA